MTSTPRTEIDFTHSRPLWVSVFLDTLVLSDGRVLAEGIYGPEHLLQALDDHRLRAVGDASELLDGSIDALDVLPLHPSASRASS